MTAAIDCAFPIPPSGLFSLSIQCPLFHPIGGEAGRLLQDEERKTFLLRLLLLLLLPLLLLLLLPSFYPTSVCVWVHCAAPWQKGGKDRESY